MKNEKINKPLPVHIKRVLKRAPRTKWHPIIHHVRKKYKISRKTIFYLKEYGPHSHVAHVIIKESIKILILASIISSIGGIGLQSIETKIFAILPLLIMLPALTDMIGDFGTVVSAKFTAMLYLGKVKTHNWMHDPEIKKLFRIIMSVAMISAIYLSIVSACIAVISGYTITTMLFIKVLEIALLATIFLVGIIFSLSIIGGLYIFSKHEDPNNFLIPITTSVADLGSLIIFAVLVATMF